MPSASNSGGELQAAEEMNGNITGHGTISDALPAGSRLSPGIDFREETPVSGYGAHSPLRRVESSGATPLYYCECATSTMDAAFLLAARDRFPEWSSVLAGQQKNGRGQFKRTWISPPGNLYASIRLPQPDREFPLTPFILALAVNRVLTGLGLFAEFKWPNDILVNREKAGGILVEERPGVTIAGVGLNLSGAPPVSEMRSCGAIPACCLKESGVFLPPLELWQAIAGSIMDHLARFRNRPDRAGLVRSLGKSLAFAGERVVTTAPDGREFPATVAGLSESGGIRLKTQEGEKILFSGSILPIAC
jgi:BirA family transcriptional regulator, biotin operon repressor / biotin---[acetyl-CoA-carboxylase] ligase